MRGPSFVVLSWCKEAFVLFVKITELFICYIGQFRIFYVIAVFVV